MTRAGSDPNVRTAAYLPLASRGAFLTFPSELSNGSSCQTPTFCACSISPAEQPTFGRASECPAPPWIVGIADTNVPRGSPSGPIAQVSQRGTPGGELNIPDPRRPPVELTPLAWPEAGAVHDLESIMDRSSGLEYLQARYSLASHNIVDLASAGGTHPQSPFRIYIGPIRHIRLLEFRVRRPRRWRRSRSPIRSGCRRDRSCRPHRRFRHIPERKSPCRFRQTSGPPCWYRC